MLDRLTLAMFAIMASITPGLAQTVSVDPRQAPAGLYQLEPHHTQVEFAIRHFGLTDYFGRFERASGTLSFDPSDPTKSAVDISIDTTSLSTTSPELNKSLQEPPIFDTGHFPTATFKSVSATRTGPNTGTVQGELTIKGITKPVTLNVTYNGSAPNPMLPKSVMLGFHATTTIRRSDYNMTGVMWSPFVGDEVKLDIEAPFVMKGQ